MLSDATLDVMHLSYERSDYADEDFFEDISRVYSIMRMLRKYIKHGETSPRAIVNHIVILYNVFGHTATFALDEEVDDKCKIYLDTCLFMMGRKSDCNIDSLFLEYLESSLS